MMMMVVMMMINDDDNDNVVEGTCTGPHAVRSDVKHQVSHSAKIFIFYHVFSSYEEDGLTGAGKTRCLPVLVLVYIDDINDLYWTIFSSLVWAT